MNSLGNLAGAAADDLLRQLKGPPLPDSPPPPLPSTGPPPAPLPSSPPPPLPGNASNAPLPFSPPPPLPDATNNAPLPSSPPPPLPGSANIRLGSAPLPSAKPVGPLLPAPKDGMHNGMQSLIMQSQARPLNAITNVGTTSGISCNSGSLPLAAFGARPLNAIAHLAATSGISSNSASSQLVPFGSTSQNAKLPTAASSSLVPFGSTSQTVKSPSSYSVTHTGIVRGTSSAGYQPISALHAAGAAAAVNALAATDADALKHLRGADLGPLRPSALNVGGATASINASIANSAGVSIPAFNAALPPLDLSDEPEVSKENSGRSRARRRSSSRGRKRSQSRKHRRSDSRSRSRSRSRKRSDSRKRSRSRSKDGAKEESCVIEVNGARVQITGKIVAVRGQWAEYMTSAAEYFYRNLITGQFSITKPPDFDLSLARPTSEVNLKLDVDSGPATVYIFQMPSNWGEAELTQLFSPFGELLGSKVERDTCKVSMQCGTVTYASQREAMTAVSHMNGFGQNKNILKVQLTPEMRMEYKSERFNERRGNDHFFCRGTGAFSIGHDDRTRWWEEAGQDELKNRNPKGGGMRGWSPSSSSKSGSPSPRRPPPPDTEKPFKFTRVKRGRGDFDFGEERSEKKDAAPAPAPGPAPALLPVPSAIQQIQGMGFSAEEAKNALDAGNGDVERAVALLLDAPMRQLLDARGIASSSVVPALASGPNIRLHILADWEESPPGVYVVPAFKGKPKPVLNQAWRHAEETHIPLAVELSRLGSLLEHWGPRSGTATLQWTISEKARRVIPAPTFANIQAAFGAERE